MNVRLLTLVLLLCGAIHGAKAQETLFGSNGLDVTGIWYTNTHNFSFFEDDSEYFRGGSIDLEFGERFFLGWSWQRMKDHASFEESSLRYKVRHHGLKLGYAPNAGKVVHPYLSVYAGGGEIDVANGPDDRIFGLTPSGGVEVNITSWFRLGAEAGYRFITDVDLADFESSDFSTPFAQLQLRFGFSWGSW